MKNFLIFSLIICSTFAEKFDNRFDGFKVFRLKTVTREQNELLMNSSRNLNIDFWREPNNNGSPVDVMVEPDDQDSFLQLMSKNGLNPEVFIDDVQSLMDLQNVGNYLETREMDWTSYYSLDDIYSWFNDLKDQYKDKVTIIDAGFSYEARMIKGLKIALNPGKRGILIEGGMHGREWISTATVTGLINEILTSTDPDFQKIAASFEWHLFPVTNPDGYVYTHTKNRLWHKTRTPYQNCFGADPNKNWDVDWNGLLIIYGTIDWSCSDYYAGTKPFSEIETESFSGYITSLECDIDVYLSFRSYSQSFLIPYGYTDEHYDNYDEMMKIGQKAVEALKNRHNTDYEVGTIAESKHLSSGDSIDWVKQEFRLPIVAAYELRDLGKYGYLLPSDEIILNNEEIFDSLVAMLHEAEELGYVELERTLHD